MGRRLLPARPRAEGLSVVPAGTDFRLNLRVRYNRYKRRACTDRTGSARVKFWLAGTT